MADSVDPQPRRSPGLRGRDMRSGNHEPNLHQVMPDDSSYTASRPLDELELILDPAKASATSRPRRSLPSPAAPDARTASGPAPGHVRGPVAVASPVERKYVGRRFIGGEGRRG